MKTYLKILLATAALTAAASPAFAQASANTSATGTTKIVQPITITKVTDLAFGTFVRSTTATTNTVTVDATTGARAVTGSGDGVGVTGPAVTRASYTVGGEGGQTFSISVPATFNMTSGGNTITVSLTASAATGTLSGTIGSAGSSTIGVGGAYTVNNTQASGSYTGSFTTTVTYN